MFFGALQNIEQLVRIQDWTEKHIGHRLPVTCEKDYGMIELWDDRAVRVIHNKGEIWCAADLCE